ncbi:hypothetical protein RUND412_000013 [Rhizina undulata]
MDEIDEAGTIAVGWRELAKSLLEVWEANTTMDNSGESEGLSQENGTQGSWGVGNIFGYVASKWALLCFVMAVMLNRTLIYASLRRPVRLPFKFRLFMRLLPILLFASQTREILLFLRCQTSPLFNGSETPSSPYLYSVGKLGNWWMDDRGVCKSIRMLPDSEWISDAIALKQQSQDELNPNLFPNAKSLRGSLELLWPLYKTLSLSQFVETFTCAVTGRTPAAETGLTLLEYSLAFAEAEVVAGRKRYIVNVSMASEAERGDGETSDEIRTFEEDTEANREDGNRITILGERKVSPEVLYVALISSLGHLTSHILGILNLQSRCRLLSTGVWGCAFLFGFSYTMVTKGLKGILLFPTVCIVGFIPHLGIFFSILICSFIYILAFALSIILGPAPTDGRSRVKAAFENLRANLHLSTLSVGWHEDFYNSLLKVGYACLLAASEATYLNEGRPIRVPGWTWLEGERMKVMSRNPATGIEVKKEGEGEGPYACERKDAKGMVGRKREGRWTGAGEVVKGVGVVLARWGVAGVGRAVSGSERETQRQVLERTMVDRFWEEVDDGDFVPEESSSSEGEDSDNDGQWEDEPNENTQIVDYTASNSFPNHSQNNEPPNLLDYFSSPAQLASLLDPQTPEQRETARVMARHLTADKILTRRGYRDALASEQRTLLSYSPTASYSPSVNPVAEEQTLESIIIQRRGNKHQHHQDEGEEGNMGGPLCVVCQSAQRCILVWPCRCLAICEDCRVSLAMNNYGSCVCCRRNLEGFSRIYVP